MTHRVCREGEKSNTQRPLMQATHIWEIGRLALLSCGTSRLKSKPFGSAKDMDKLGANTEWTVILVPTENDFTSHSSAKRPRMPKKAQVYLRLITNYPGPMFFKAELRSQAEAENADNAAIKRSLRNACCTSANGAQVESIHTSQELGIGTVEIPEAGSVLKLRVDIAYFIEASKTRSLREPSPNDPEERGEWEGDYPLCTLTEDIEDMMLDEDADVVLVDAEGKEHKAHRAILRARSPVFAAMFKSDMQESQNGRVNITDLSGEAIKQMIRYIYTGDVDEDTLTADTLAVANRYQLPRLKFLCERDLALTPENAITVLAAANLHEAKNLKKFALKFVSTNMAEVMASAAWKEATPDLLRQVSEALASKCDDLARPPSDSEDEDD